MSVRGDVDRTFWEVMAADHGRLLGNAVRWAANEPAPVDVDGPSVLDVTARIRLGDGMRPARVQLLTAAATPQTTFANGVLSVVVPSVDVHEVIAIDLEP